MSLIQAILLGFISFLSGLGISYNIVFEFTCVPMIMSTVAGIILGDPKTGLMCGAIIQPMYLAFMNAGGNVPADKGNGSLLATALVISSGLSTDVALAMTIPLTLILAQIANLKKIARGYVNEIAEKCAVKGDDKGIVASALIGTCIISLIFYWIPISVAAYLGSDLLSNLNSALPAFVTGGLSAIGHVLPSIGIAATMIAIGRRDFLPFFVFAFFIAQYTGIGSLELLLYAGLITFVYFLVSKQTLSLEDAKLFEASDNEDNAKKLLTKKDLFWLWERWHFFCETATSFTHLQGQAFCIAFIPILKKLYGEGSEEYKNALASHMAFYNTSGNFGGLVNGIVAAMEEQRALAGEKAEEVIPRDSINTVKIGLMGPVAGIGDTIDFSTIKVITLAFFVTYAQAGYMWAPFAYLVVVFCYWYAEGLFLTNIGYKYGAQAAGQLLGSPLFKLIFSCAALLGYFMIGGMSASMVSVTTPLVIAMKSGLTMAVQADILDQIVPGLLSIIVIFIIYGYLSHKGSIIKATWFALLIAFVLGAVGILA